MNTYVWVDSWQQQCCGDDFEVGTSVTWAAVPAAGPHEWVGSLLGSEWAERVAFREERHTDDATTTVVLAGTVMSIREVTCRRTPQPHGSAQMLVPVPGSGMLHEVRAADKWSAEPSDDMRDRVSFDGWIVELDPDLGTMTE